MTAPEDSPNGTRPISVAELLAKNGTIGAPPVGGRRRRRRGNSDSVTVAELTGEIPVVEDEEDTDAQEAADPADLDEGFTDDVDNHVETAEPVTAPRRDDRRDDRRRWDDRDHRDARDAQVQPDEDYTDAEADYSAHLQARDVDPEPVEFEPQRRRPHYGRPQGHAPRRFPSAAPARPAAPRPGAEGMSPDPRMEYHDEYEGDSDYEYSDDYSDYPEEADSAVGLVEAPGSDYADDDLDADYDEGLDDVEGADEDDLHDGTVSSYLRSTQGELFGGQSMADERARRGRRSGIADLELDDLADEHDERHDDDHDDWDDRDEHGTDTMSPFARGAWIVGQCVIAVAFGAGLFVAFDQLWKWNNIVALVLSVLVILGLVVGVRVVRKTEDIGSTMIAVAVGALVTLGPLALLQSG